MTSRLRTLVPAVAASTTVSLASACSGDDSPRSLRDGIVAEYERTGVAVSVGEVDCLASDLSVALGLPDEATYDEYTEAVRARTAAWAVTLPTVGSNAFDRSVPTPTPDTLVQATVSACVNDDHEIQVLAWAMLGGTTPWSELSEEQQVCLMDAVEPFVDSLEGVPLASELAEQCDVQI